VIFLFCYVCLGDLILNLISWFVPFKLLENVNQRGIHGLFNLRILSDWICRLGLKRGALHFRKVQIHTCIHINLTVGFPFSA
jgi:hypothetical protein